MARTLWLVTAVLVSMGSTQAAELTYKQRFSKLLIEATPPYLENYDPETGRFGKGVWICSDQNVMWPLAVVYTLDVPGNKYHKDPDLLEAIMKAGEALAADADPQGRWVFRKKDNSTWGMIHMPWTYSRWIRTFGLIREDMPADRRAAWEKALTNGYENISKTALGSHHNIPTHHAMGLYIAGKLLDRPAWCEQATKFLQAVAAAQSPNGYWSEGQGPVVVYNFVYVDAIGTYYALSKDESVRPALERASLFHRNFTYPDGNSVETIDQRNPFRDSVNAGNLGFTFDPVGRAFLASQWAQFDDDDFPADLMASFVSYGQEGPIEATDSDSTRTYVLAENGKDLAMTVRRGPWFLCLSAFTTPLSNSRWIQDRQNLVSIYHDEIGLIVGGGNTKLQPAWSNFTIGDTQLLAHKAGDTDPRFSPAGELYHVPSAARLVGEPQPGLELTYGPEDCLLQVDIKDDRTLEYIFSSSTKGELPIEAHVILLPRMGEVVRTAAGKEFKLSSDEISLSPEQVGGSIQYAGCELSFPKHASLLWPVLPHNPYVKDGSSSPPHGRLVICVPLTSESPRGRVTIRVK